MVTVSSCLYGLFITNVQISATLTTKVCLGQFDNALDSVAINLGNEPAIFTNKVRALVIS